MQPGQLLMQLKQLLRVPLGVGMLSAVPPPDAWGKPTKTSRYRPRWAIPVPYRVPIFIYIYIVPYYDGTSCTYTYYYSGQ